MLSALREAHAAGLIHRDLKPANIMIEERGEKDYVRILDFGIAKIVGEGPEGAGTEPITKSGAIVGTVQYMSPEQALGEKIDARSDLYSLATILYETLTGARPIEAENRQKLLYKLATEEAVPLKKRVRGVSRDLERLIMKNLAKEPAKRSASAEEFLAELESCTDELKSTIAIRRKGMPAAVPIVFGILILVIATVAVTAYLLSQAKKPSAYPGLPPTESGEEWTPEGIEQARKKAVKAYEEALAQKDHLAALKHITSAIRFAAAGDALEESRLQKLKSDLDAEMEASRRLFKDAQQLDKKGEKVTALRFYNSYIKKYPHGESFGASTRRAGELSRDIEAFKGLVVVTDPPGATVALDGKEVGKTPLMYAGVRPGRHALRLSLAGHHPVKKEVSYEGKRLSVREVLRKGTFGSLHLVSTGDRLILEVDNVPRGMTPLEEKEIEVGEHTVRVSDERGRVSYAFRITVQEGRTAYREIDFGKMKAEEIRAFQSMDRGTDLGGTRTLWKEFLARYPTGVKAGEVRRTLEALDREEAAWAACKGATEEEDVKKACGKYLASWGGRSYPLGWFGDEAQALQQKVTRIQDDRAFRQIAERLDFSSRRTACESYLSRFKEGAHVAEVQQLLSGLRQEWELHDKFLMERGFQSKLDIGDAYVKRYPSGLKAEEVRKELAEKRRQEAAAFETFSAEGDPVRIVELAEAYERDFIGTPQQSAVRSRRETALAELRTYRSTELTADSCERYLAEYPEGFYRKEVAERIRTFAWTAEQSSGAGYTGKLPAGVLRSEETGEYLSPRDTSKMLYVPEGFFPMGTNDIRGEPCDTPEFTAYVPGFFIDKFEVTNRQYAAFLAWVGHSGNPNPYKFAHPEQPQKKDHTPRFWKDPTYNKPDHPVVGVDWFDAYAYARWAGKSLPTEAQWEKAACAEVFRRKKTRWPWGNQRPEKAFCNFGAEYGGTLPVSSLGDGQSPLGLFHMAGNAAEWCLDSFDETFYEKLVRGLEAGRKWVVNPCNREKSEFHAVRGGSFWDDPIELVATSRKGYHSIRRRRTVGFRCAVWRTK
jgi:formylglycine-generating enzyme required for sulfatase activity